MVNAYSNTKVKSEQFSNSLEYYKYKYLTKICSFTFVKIPQMTARTEKIIIITRLLAETSPIHISKPIRDFSVVLIQCFRNNYSLLIYSLRHVILIKRF